MNNNMSMKICLTEKNNSAFRGSGSSGEGGGVSDGRRSQRFNVVSLLVFESFTSNFIMNEHKLTYC
jgi:hypothetical protein